MTSTAKWAFLARLLLAACLPLLGGACTQELVCSADQVACGGSCASLASDPSNCGACGRGCGSGESCQAGLCCSGSQCPPAVYAACFNNSTVQGATAEPLAVGAPVALSGGGPISLAWVGSSLWVADSFSNTLERLRVGPGGPSADGEVVIPTSLPFSDLEYLAAWDGLLYASNAAVQSVVVVDPALAGVAGAQPIVGEILLEAGAYPQGIAFSGRKGYVALNGLDRIAVLDLQARTVTRTIDLSGLASLGGRAMPSRLLVTGGRLYATLWNLDATYAPAGDGRLAVVDTATDSLVPGVNPVDLGAGCLDPGGLALRGSRLFVTCGFFPYDSPVVTGASIVPVELSGPAPAVLAPTLTPGLAGGAITFCGGGGYVGDRASGTVVRLDAATGVPSAQAELCVPRAGGSGYVADVACGR
jgi:hypothetical protein